MNNKNLYAAFTPDLNLPERTPKEKLTELRRQERRLKAELDLIRIRIEELIESHPELVEPPILPHRTPPITLQNPITPIVFPS